jgi:hypothetical protein
MFCCQRTNNKLYFYRFRNNGDELTFKKDELFQGSGENIYARGIG